MYVASKMTNKIETVLSSFIHPQLKDGDVIPTSKLIKLIEGFPVFLHIFRCWCTKAVLKPIHVEKICFVLSKDNTNSLASKILGH